MHRDQWCDRTLCPQKPGSFRKLGDFFFESRKEGGTQKVKGGRDRQLVFNTLVPHLVPSSDTFLGQLHLWFPKCPSPPPYPLLPSGAGKEPGPGSPPGPSRPLCTRPVTGSPPGRSHGDPDQNRAGGTLRTLPEAGTRPAYAGEIGLSFPALVSRKLLTGAKKGFQNPPRPPRAPETPSPPRPFPRLRIPLPFFLFSFPPLSLPPHKYPLCFLPSCFSSVQSYSL